MSETHCLAVMLALICAVLAAVGQLLFKLGAVYVTGEIASWLANWRVMSGMLLYGLSAVLFVLALKHGKLTVLYPLIATSYIWVALLSNRFLGEPVSLGRWIGIGLIISGISVVAIVR